MNLLSYFSPIYALLRGYGLRIICMVIIIAVCLGPLWPAFKKMIESRRQKEREEERRLEILRLVKERNHRFDCNDESYKDIQSEINQFTSDMDKSAKKELGTWLFAQLHA